MTSEITVEQMRHSTSPQIEAWCGWAKANGLNPNIVSAAHPVTVEGDAIRYHEQVRTLSGQRLAHPDGNQVVTIERIAPLIVPMPEAWPEP